MSDRSNAEITHSMQIFTAVFVTQNHGDSRKSRHTTKIAVKARDYLTALRNVTINGHTYTSTNFGFELLFI